MKMKKLHWICLSVLMMVCATASAGTADSSKVKLAYDIKYDMNFDNREFSKSKFSPSMTIFGARFTPTVGFAVEQPGDLTHKVMIGADVMADFGVSQDSTDLAGEITFWYQLDKKIGKTSLGLQAGIFPRSSMEADYSEAFFSDSLRFYDNNLEGILLKLRRPGAYFELGCDWMGKYSKYSRERFMVFSGGAGKILPFLSAGYSAYMYHYANSGQVRGVVDNFLVYPYLQFDFAQMTGLQKLSLQAGWIETMQNDRVNIGHYMFSGGANVEFDIKHWNFGIRNVAYYGNTLMPLYNIKDKRGNKYGSNLYPGDPFYRVDDKDSFEVGLYDRVEAYYDLNLDDYLKLRVTAAFHIAGFKYAGCQQMVRLMFDLNELLDRK